MMLHHLIAFPTDDPNREILISRTDGSTFTVQGVAIGSGWHIGEFSSLAAALDAAAAEVAELRRPREART